MEKDKIDKLREKLERTVDILTIKLSDKMFLEYEKTTWDENWILTIDEDGRGGSITDTTALALIQAANGPTTKISHSFRMMEDDELNDYKKPPPLA